MSIPNRTAEKIMEAVEHAIDSGVMVEQFIQEARASWWNYMVDKQKADDAAFGKAQK